MEEASGGGSPGSSLGTGGSPGSSLDTLWGSLEAGVARGGLEPESLIFHCVLWVLSSRRAISFESGEGPCQQVPQNTRKTRGRSWG